MPAFHRLHILALLAASDGACAEDPSFRLRWRVATGDDPVPPLASPFQCASVGIAGVRASTLDAASATVDERDFPCFPAAFVDPEATTRGPALARGTYRVVLRGLRGDGAGWPEGTVQDEAELPVVDGETVHLDRFVLEAPPECDDGVDNDRDGLVDGFDPSCISDRTSDERMDSSAIRFRVTTTFFGQNPNATCKRVGVQAIRLLVDGDPGTVQDIPCRDATEIFAWDVGGGEHVASATAIGLRDGTSVLLTEARSVRFLVVEGQTAQVDLELDFAAADFLEPIVSPARFAVAFAADDSSRGCEPGPGEGKLVLDRVRLRVLGEDGKVPDPPVTLEDGTPLEGGADLACPSTILTTAPLSWGSYAIAVDAFAGAVLCFTSGSDPVPAAPGEAFLLIVPRRAEAVSSGQCLDCASDSDCGGCLGCCQDGICRP